MKQVIAILAVATFVSGCDIARSVSWRAQVDELPSSDCVERSLRAVAGITNVEAITENHLPVEYSYRGDRFWGNVAAIHSREGSAVVTVTASWLNEVPSRDEIVANREVFARIFQSLKKHCPPMPPLSDIHETFLNMPAESVPDHDLRISN